MIFKTIKIIEIPNVHEERGKLAVIEKDIIPFDIQRIYYLFDVPNDAYRGGHAHISQQSVVIALSGSFDVILDDGENKTIVTLSKPNEGLYIPTGVWREIEDFSSGAVCLVIASTEFDESDYVRDYNVFKSSKNS